MTIVDELADQERVGTVVDDADEVGVVDVIGRGVELEPKGAGTALGGVVGRGDLRAFGYAGGDDLRDLAGLDGDGNGDRTHPESSGVC